VPSIVAAITIGYVASHDLNLAVRAARIVCVRNISWLQRGGAGLAVSHVLLESRAIVTICEVRDSPYAEDLVPLLLVQVLECPILSMCRCGVARVVPWRLNFHGACLSNQQRNTTSHTRT
jgi:hypothetical protein